LIVSHWPDGKHFACGGPFVVYIPPLWVYLLVIGLLLRLPMAPVQARITK
jgi:hypothetical protein